MARPLQLRAGPLLYWGESGPQLTPAGCDQGCRRVAARRCPAVVCWELWRQDPV